MAAVYTALIFIIKIVREMLPDKRPAANQEDDNQPSAFITVSPVRARVLCQRCLGENDETFHYCQWCAQARSTTTGLNQEAPIPIDEVAIAKRRSQFRKALVNKASQKSRSATMELFSKFLASRKTGRVVLLEEAQPQDVIDFLCWLDSCGTRRRTIVHARDCHAVGTLSLSACSTEKGECGRRYAHDSLRTNHVSKLAVGFEKELGMLTDWSNSLKAGNPVRSEPVTQYMAFTTGEQKLAGVLVKQAPALLRSHLTSILRPMQVRLRSTGSLIERITLARDIAFFTVLFSTTKRGDELTRTLIQRILRLPNRSGLMFNFQFGKTQRDGADHIVTIAYDEVDVAMCPVRAVEQLVAVGDFIGWHMTTGYLFPTILSATKDGKPVRGSTDVSTQYMSSALKRYAKEAGETQDFSLHSFRSGGAISRALAGDSLSSIMQRAYWKNPKTAWRYMRLMEVLAPGSGGDGMVPGVTEEQYRELNEFSLSEQSRSLAAFGNAPML